MTVREQLRRLHALREQLSPAIDLYDEVTEVALAESPHPHDKILALLPSHQRALAKVDDAAAARVIAAYAAARQELADDITKLYGRYFGPGDTPTIDQKVRFVKANETLQLLTQREAELSGATAKAITKGWDDAVVLAIAKSGSEMAAMAEAFPILQTGDPFAIPAGVAEEIGLNKAVQDVSHIAKETRDLAAQALVTGALVGEGVAQMTRRLTPVFDGNRRRAELTSRYATIRAYNESNVIHYQEVATQLAPFGRVVYKQWLTSVDDRACPICLALHGTLVGLEGDFDLSATFAKHKPPKGYPVADALQYPPRHARCRCSVVPWVDGWEKGTSMTPAAMQAQAQAWARAHGFDPGQQVVAGAKVPTPHGRRPHSTEIASLPKDQYDGAVRAYLSCSTGKPTLPSTYI